MSTELNKVLARRIVEEMWNTHNLKVIDEVYATEFGGGHEASKQFVSAQLAVFPDLQITIQDQIAENDLVATRYIIQGTHQGEFLNIPPTGKQFTTTGIEMHRFTDGKLVELWNVVDILSTLQQLGVLQK